MNARTLTLATAVALMVTEAANAQITIVTSRPGGDAIDWGQLNVYPNNPFQTPQPFQSFGGINGKIDQEGTTYTWMQCCSPRFGGTYDGNFAQGDWLIITFSTPGPPQIALSFKEPLRSVGAQIAGNNYGPYTAQIKAFNHNKPLGSFTENGNLTTLADNSAIFLGVQSTQANITDVIFTVTMGGASETVVINQVEVSQ
jgi:hypothetical protein